MTDMTQDGTTATWAGVGSHAHTNVLLKKVNLTEKNY
ncbi:hypothetical protein B6N60_02997 [Richelia sinica FACHB-800]|uniref:Uncharacterized protein n=1 Tax=Richelia sinica FACHB-800 TaxID=1357546 RepID=A0A975TA73_9NOST|nr:hypothetical protein B6N60_02997 [Richelia sinica FACHB-800]